MNMRAPTSTTKYNVGGVLRARPFDVGRLGHFGLYVKDIAASAHFYRDVLGFHVTDHLYVDDERVIGTFLTYNADHHAMVLIDAAVGEARGPNYGRGVTVNQMSFQVSTLQEVMDADEMLRDHGLPVTRVGRDVPGSNWAVYFTDPDGHTVELFYGMEQIGWDRRSKPLSAFGQYRALDAPSLPQPSELEEVRSVEESGADTGCGHRWDDNGDKRFDVGGVLLARPFRIVNSGPISLFVEDLDASIAFYRDHLGLAVTERVEYAGHDIAFLRSGTEHHTITLVPLPLREELGLDTRSTLVSYGLQVGGYQQLRAAVDFLKSKGYVEVSIPRELYTGISYAAHFVDPEGHRIALYHEMEQVGTAGRPLTPAERRPAESVWPEVLPAHGATTPNATFQGPIG